jgi:transcriptional regulator with XRE-family HTH domain
MDNVEFLALRVFNEMHQTEWGQQFGISQTYVSQLERGERPVPDDLAERVERQFAVGSPQDDDEQICFLVGAFHSSGEIEVPDDLAGIPIFQQRAGAAEVVRRLREEANVSGAMVVPVWRNGIAQLVGRRRKADEIDATLFRDLVRRFVRNSKQR